MFDEIKENPKLLGIITITSIFAILILVIFLIVIIWMPKSKDNKELTVKNDDKIVLGNYTQIDMTEKKVIEKYSREILNIFSSNDELQLNYIVLPEYLKFRNIGKSELKKVLTQKGIIGKKIRLSDYKAMINPRYGKIFEINVQSYDNLYSDKLLLIQKSPNNYKISFDNFIGLNTNVKSCVKEGFKLDISEIKELTTMVSINMTITNISGHSIIINKENNYENIYLRLATGAEVRMGSVWLGGETKELITGNTYNLKCEFALEGFNSGSAKSIIIKNVYDTLTKETKDIEFLI
ncbi:MAG: hypothetical protein RR144_03790 [Clostridia bacterium]